MALRLTTVRELALALPGATEEPHFDMVSFRVRGKIFATVPPDGLHLHVFVDDAETQACVAEHPEVFEPLLWGGKLRGLQVRLAGAARDRVGELLEESWRRKAPARLIAERAGETPSR
ncbi:MAG TPA: MmcQ/YjbR family DNA-binding protein [Streptosporangiaceae bacterium]|nr:MmcQ/YjbR family DNA-binding protein [Streptosporangiaceae bacterium]